MRAIDAYGGATAFSNQDLATTISFISVTSGTTITFGQIDQLRTAVNAVRAANGWAALDWSSMISAPTPVPAVGVQVYGAHIMALRAKMDEARGALLGGTQPAYTDPTLPGTPRVAIRAIHVTELQGRAQ